MKKIIQSTLIVAGCALAINVSADAVVDEVWSCELKDGKEFEDVYAANAEWVKHMNSAVDAGEIKSGTVTPIVGKHDGHFMYVDTYSSLAAWAAADEYQNSDAGEAAMEAINDALEAVADCKSNRLFRYTPN